MDPQPSASWSLDAAPITAWTLLPVLPPTPVHGKIVSTKPVTGSKKVGDCRSIHHHKELF